MVTEIRLPIRPRTGSAYEKVERRVGDWAVGAAGASLSLAEDGTVADVGIGLTALGLEGTATSAEEVLLGARVTDELIDEAARRAAAASDPTEDQRGPVDYKRHLAEELTRRVLHRALARATENAGG
jgi:carbon-monoxide dehydrogenase medium subunit